MEGARVVIFFKYSMYSRKGDKQGHIDTPSNYLTSVKGTKHAQKYFHSFTS